MTTATASPAIAGEIEIFTRQTKAIHGVVRRNVEGLTQEDSLVQPQPGGNCLNWVIGHLLSVYDLVLPVLGEKPVMEPNALKRYERGSAELHEAGEAIPLADLLVAWDESAKRVEAGLGTLTADEASQALEAAGIASARLRTPEEFTRHPQLRARLRWRQVHTSGGDIDALLPPVEIAGQTPVVGPVPALGEHTDAVRAEFGTAPAEGPTR